MKIADEYVEIRNKFIEMLSDFETRWDGLSRINIAKHRINLSSAYARLIQSALYCTSTEARRSEKSEIDEMVLKEAIKPSQTEWQHQ